MTIRVFSDGDLERLRSFPEINREELIRFFTLTPAHIEFIDPGRGRGPSDRLGLAVQLCTLPWLGFVPDAVTSAPAVAVARLSERLQMPRDELRFYGERDQTRTDHLRSVARYLGWRQASALELEELDEFLLARALEHDSPTLLFRLACEHLISALSQHPDPLAPFLQFGRWRRKRPPSHRYRRNAPWRPSWLTSSPTWLTPIDRCIPSAPTLLTSAACSAGVARLLGRTGRSATHGSMAFALASFARATHLRETSMGFPSPCTPPFPGMPCSLTPAESPAQSSCARAYCCLPA